MKSDLVYIKYRYYFNNDTTKNIHICSCIVKVDYSNDNEKDENNIESISTLILKSVITRLRYDAIINVMNIKVLNKDDLNDINKISNAFKIFIFKDYHIDKYIMRNYNEPNLSILNYLFDKFTVKIFILGNQPEYNNKEKLSLLETNIKRFVNTNNINSCFYNLKNKNNKIDISYINESLLKNDKNNLFVLLLPNNINLDELDEILFMFRNKPNIHIMMHNKNSYYKIQEESNDSFIFKRI